MSRSAEPPTVPNEPVSRFGIPGPRNPPPPRPAGSIPPVSSPHANAADDAPPHPIPLDKFQDVLLDPARWAETHPDDLPLTLKVHRQLRKQGGMPHPTPPMRWQDLLQDVDPWVLRELEAELSKRHTPQEGAGALPERFEVSTGAVGTIPVVDPYSMQAPAVPGPEYKQGSQMQQVQEQSEQNSIVWSSGGYGGDSKSPLSVGSNPWDDGGQGSSAAQGQTGNLAGDIWAAWDQVLLPNLDMLEKGEGLWEGGPLLSTSWMGQNHGLGGV